MHLRRGGGCGTGGGADQRWRVGGDGEALAGGAGAGGGEVMDELMSVQPPSVVPESPIAPPPVYVAVKPPAISTRDLTKRYGHLVALDALNLELESGDVFGFIG